jgi:hypothetical protein
VWNTLRAANRRHKELWTLDKTLSGTRPLGSCRDEFSEIYTERGKIYKQLADLYRLTWAEMLPTANDCFEELEFRFLGEPAADEARSILQEFRTVVVPAFP